MSSSVTSENLTSEEWGSDWSEDKPTTAPGQWNWNDPGSKAVGQDMGSKAAKQNALIVIGRALAERIQDPQEFKGRNANLILSGGGGEDSIYYQFAQQYCITLAFDYVDRGNTTALPNPIQPVPINEVDYFNIDQTTIINDTIWAHWQYSLYNDVSGWSPKRIYDLRFTDYNKAWPYQKNGPDGWRRFCEREICTTDPAQAAYKGKSIPRPYTDSNGNPAVNYNSAGPSIYTAFQTSPEVGDVARLVIYTAGQLPSVSYGSNKMADGSPQICFGIDHNSQYAADDRKNAGKYYQWDGSKWDEYTDRDAPFRAVIADMGLIQLGDYIGPWIVEDLNLAINQLTTTFHGSICADHRYPISNVTGVYGARYYSSSSVHELLPEPLKMGVAESVIRCVCEATVFQTSYVPSGNDSMMTGALFIDPFTSGRNDITRKATFVHCVQTGYYDYGNKMYHWTFEKPQAVHTDTGNCYQIIGPDLVSEVPPSANGQTGYYYGSMCMVVDWDVPGGFQYTKDTTGFVPATEIKEQTPCDWDWECGGEPPLPKCADLDMTHNPGICTQYKIILQGPGILAGEYIATWDEDESFVGDGIEIKYYYPLKLFCNAIWRMTITRKSESNSSSSDFRLDISSSSSSDNETLIYDCQQAGLYAPPPYGWTIVGDQPDYYSFYVVCIHQGEFSSDSSHSSSSSSSSSDSSKSSQSERSNGSHHSHGSNSHSSNHSGHGSNSASTAPTSEESSSLPPSPFPTSEESEPHNATSEDFSSLEYLSSEEMGSESSCPFVDVGGPTGEHCFGIGSCATWIAPASGTLNLFFNDYANSFGDNSGDYLVIVNSQFVQVMANSLSTSINVVSGTQYSFTAHGTCDSGSGGGSHYNGGPNGVRVKTGAANLECPTANFGALAARFFPFPSSSSSSISSDSSSSSSSGHCTRGPYAAAYAAVYAGGDCS